MKYLLLLTLLVSCGYSEKGSEATGQVKKIINETPLVCSNFNTVDVSLGVIRGGVGSMSSEDKHFLVENDALLLKLKQANESGKLVSIKYDKKRFAWCTPMSVVTEVMILP